MTKLREADRSLLMTVAVFAVAALALRVAPSAVSGTRRAIIGGGLAATAGALPEVRVFDLSHNHVSRDALSCVVIIRNWVRVVQLR